MSSDLADGPSLVPKVTLTRKKADLLFVELPAIDCFVFLFVRLSSKEKVLGAVCRQVVWQQHQVLLKGLAI